MRLKIFGWLSHLAPLHARFCRFLARLHRRPDVRQTDVRQHHRLMPLGGGIITLGLLFTLRAKLSGAVYCNRSCLFVCVCLWVCYHDNLKLRASISTKLGLWVKVVTISSWLNFGGPALPGRGSAPGQTFLVPPYYSQRAVFASLWALFSLKFDIMLLLQTERLN